MGHRLFLTSYMHTHTLHVTEKIIATCYHVHCRVHIHHNAINFLFRCIIIKLHALGPRVLYTGICDPV